MNKVLNKLFIGGDWRVKLFAHNKEQVIEPEKGYWYADPFLFTYKNKDYLFVEAFNKKKELGFVGYLSNEDNYSKLNVLIEEKYHFSFPNVFVVNNCIYMIPESSEKNGIYLYSFDNFPNGLKPIKKLCSGPFVDTALVCIHDKQGFFITYDSKEKALYSLNIDFENYGVKINKIIEDSDKMYRPAGNAFLKKEDIIVPFQNNHYKYGESILLRKVIIGNGEISIDDNFTELKPRDFAFNKEVKRMHTYNVLDDDHYVVDYMVEKLCLTKTFKMMKRKIRRKKHGKEFQDE